MRYLGKVLALILCVWCSQGYAQSTASQVPHIYLIQNSGWMLAYYKDPNARFREFIQQLIATTAPPGARIIIADFNTENQVRGRASPRVLASGPNTPEFVQRAINGMDPEPPRKTSEPGAMVDADYAQAIDNAFRQPDLANQSGAVIWMITNNKFAPDSTGGRLDAGVASLTARFNKSLKEDANIIRILALIKQLRASKPVDRGVEFEGRGLVVYAFSYGEEADPSLQEAARKLENSRLFDTRPAKLKPLAIGPLTFTPERIKTPGVDFEYVDGRLILTNVPSDTAVTIEVQGTLSSNYYPQVIDAAIVVMTFESQEGIENVSTFAAALSREQLYRLRPGQKLEDVVLTLQLPPIVRPSILSEEERINGIIRFSIKEVRLELWEEFNNRMKEIFAADQWKAVFLDNFAVTQAATEMPILIIVPFSILPIFLALLGLLLAALAVMALLWLATRNKRATVLIDGEKRTAIVKPWGKAVLRGRDGKPVAEVTGSLLGEPKVRFVSTADGDPKPAGNPPGKPKGGRGIPSR